MPGKRIKRQGNCLSHEVDNWNVFYPVPQLKPIFGHGEGENGFFLEIEGTGNERVFGCWETVVTLKRDNWYEACVNATVTGIESPDLSLLAVAAGHFLEPEELGCGRLRLRQVFFYNGGEQYKDRFSLFLRASATGKVRWENPVLQKTDPPPRRCARIATVRFPEILDKEAQTPDGLRNRISIYLEEAGKISPDLVLLTEFAPVAGVDGDSIAEYGGIAEALGGDTESFYWKAAEKVPDGPTCRILSEMARKYGMYVAAGLPEKREGLVFNTAVIFGRDGEFVGQYDKTHLTFGELVQGISCGKDYPVFDLDFGRIAIHICYDEWFPEVTRYYALRGAEIILLPVAGGKPITWRTRAIDNNVYFVTASSLPPSMIIDSSGEILAETHHGGFVYADLELDRRKVNYYGDRTLVYGMPGVAGQMANTLDHRLPEELARIYKGDE